MLLKVNVIQAKDFIVSTLTGELDLKTSQIMLGKIAAAAKGRGAFDVLIDLRQTAIRMSTVDIWDLCTGLPEFVKTFAARTAILISQGKDGQKAEFLRPCVSNRGYRINIFSDYEEAMKWLYSPVSSGIEETI